MNSAFVSYEELWRSLETGIVPTEWKIAKVIPIFKSGSMAEIDNYRTISILPTLSKILENRSVSENFIHALLLFLGLFLKISSWVPLNIEEPRLLAILLDRNSKHAGQVQRSPY